MKQMKMKKWETIIIVLLFVGILAFTVIYLNFCRPTTEPVAMPTAEPEVTPQVLYQEVEKIVEKEIFVEVEKEITSSIMEEGLRNLGVLITQEYYFTEVISYSSAEKFLNIKVPLTESSYLCSYDGVVTAGIDFTNVEVEKDETGKTITIYMPTATVQSTEIDNDSFTLYDEKQGLGNPISVEDFNNGLIQLKETAKNRAIDNGLLDKATANAQIVVGNFIRSLINTTEYTVLYETIE